MKSSGPHAHKVLEGSGPQESSTATTSTHVFFGLRQRQEVGLLSVATSSTCMGRMVCFSLRGSFSQSCRSAFGFETRFGGGCVDLFLPLPLPLLLLRYL